MARFLSREWFDELSATGAEVDEPEPLDEPDLVVQVAVTGAPEGDVRYQVMVRGEQARVVSNEAAFLHAHVEMKSDYATMAGLACGKLSALDALSAGQARVSGDIGALSSKQPSLSGLDLLPAATRASTTF
jgi:hypothetical protein